MRGRSRRKKRTGKMVSLQKRFLAFMLAFAMIFTNVGTDLHVSFAASGNKVDFTIGGADLVHWKRNPTTCRLCLGGTFLSVKRLNYRQR